MAGVRPPRADGCAVSARPDEYESTRSRRSNARRPDRRSRSKGAEFSAFGSLASAWQLAATYTNQSAKIVSRTSAATPGASVAIVPHTVASLWNKVQFAPRLGLGLGASRQSDMYAAIDNKVTLRGYTRVDAAAFFSVSPSVRAQINIDNALNRKYYLTADNNNNITPGAPRAVRVSLTTGF